MTASQEPGPEAMNRSKALEFVHSLSSCKWASPPRVPSRYASARVVSLLAVLGVVALVSFTLAAPKPSASVRPPPAPAHIGDQDPTSILPPTPGNYSIVNVATLIQALKAAAEHASRGSQAPIFDAQARKEWHRRNPCRSRAELQPLYTLRRLVQDAEPNSNWTEVFKAYETLHRVCMQSVGGNLGHYFQSRSMSSSGCRFLVAGIPPGAGLGNKILSMVSGLLYAIITQRVFLIPAETLVPGIMCEPFHGSSWLFDPERKFTPEYAPGKQHYWTSREEFYREVDGAIQGRKPVESYTYALVPNDIWCHPDARFFCDTEQFYYNSVPWLYINGCFYFLPKLFAVPSFRPVLEDLFPDRMALTHLLRSAMLPSDEVWRRIDQIYSLYLKNANRRVGIQIRYRDGEKGFNATHNLIIDRVLKCALDNHILPEAGAPAGEAHLSKTQTSVFVASLYPSLHDFLGEMYVRNPPEMEYVGVVQVTRGKEQHFNDEEDKQALTEILCLSFADHLFVTPLSTFGGLAQGYGALTPWFIDNRPASESVCVRAQTVDTCYQAPIFKYDCPHDPHLHKQWVLSQVPYLKDCLPIDATYGMQLITTPR